MKLSATTSGFVLAATITVLFNTALAWAKDAFPSLNSSMQSLTGHHWTTHGLADLLVFLGLGFLFKSLKTAERIEPAPLTRLMVGSVIIAAAGLALWFAFV